MVWTSPPTKVTEARDRLLQTATVQTILTGLSAPLQEARFHYPSAIPTSDTMPYIVLSREAESYERATVGGSMGRGEIEAVFHFDDSVATGTIEEYIDIAQELVELTSDGLYVISADAERASLPSAAMQAGDDSGQPETGKSYKTLRVRLTWEG